MSNMQADIFKSQEETHKQKLSGIFMALEYIARESEKLGLKFTAHMVGVAADFAVIETAEAENPVIMPQKHEHPSTQ